MRSHTLPVARRKLPVVLALSLLAACDVQGATQRQMVQINQQVIDDAVAQYNIVKRSGSAIDRCVQAGLVAAAMLQAQDETGYADWKSTERSDCDEAGVPQ